ncbi:hypothetical protein C8J56DRAFT_1171170 [Mycena floridula]|nr:hypothetical protein C8J56DRAFT_1171170 [Mycena floridula]
MPSPYRPSLFEFDSPESIEWALLELEQTLTVNNAEQFFQAILSENENILPLVLAGVSARCVDSWLLDRFPSTAKSFVASPVTSKILFSLSRFFMLYPPPSSNLDMTKVQKVNAGLDILRALSSMSFVDTDDLDEPNETRRKDKGKTQRQAKKVRKMAAILDAVDPSPFMVLGASIPTRRSDADALAQNVLCEEKLHLQDYLETLRSSQVLDSIKSRCIMSRPLEVKSSSPEPNLAPRVDEIVDETASAFPRVQPMKSALYFDSVSGFGEWSISITTNAHNQLRATCRRDKKIFDIIRKKIKELSNGHFSDDNQKKLVGTRLDVPIYEAKMTSDLRLIYQIDCIPTGDLEREQQAIKIFDICTHAQMDKRLWDSVNRQVERKGKEYRARCSHRERVRDNIYRPALFPPLPEAPFSSTSLPELPMDSSSQAHSRLLMEKFVAFSQPLLNSIMADVDATFPHLVSLKEQKIIEHPGAAYVIGRSGTGKTTTMLFKMLLVERAHLLSGEEGPRPRQLFVTQSRVLARKVKQYFWTLLRTLETSSMSVEEMASQAKTTKKLFLDQPPDHVNDKDWHNELPERYSQLEDKHFPLIVTIDQLWCMLEADKPPVPALKTKRILLTYPVFLREYWPHFSQALTKRLDPTLVFSQLLGIIMGSEATLTIETHYLDRTSYQNVGERTQILSLDQRNAVYEIFETYRKMKLQRREFDAAERTHSIITSFQDFPGQKVDCLYVDEVQDLLLIETYVLRAMCRDSSRLFFSGDTAQCISVGSSFRFDDLKAFQYRIEEQRVMAGSCVATKPELFQLAINYRSHAGIVDCADSIIQLIQQFWPNSIDRLQPESGVVEGVKPVFYTGWDEDSGSQLEQFLFGDSGELIEFGAQQCIIVRDEQARENLQKQVGDIGIIMTIYDAKGLEFNDILLLNFFKDSSLDASQWRVILNSLQDDRLSVPTFDSVKHAAVCTDLKFLYVAITRARENIWIADTSSKSEPMRTYWNRKSLVSNVTPQMNAPQLARTSTPEEWAQTGESLFENEKFDYARRCFVKASLPNRAAIAEAYHLLTKAEVIPESKTLQRKQAFDAAAIAFLEACVFSDNRRPVHYIACAECFLKAGQNESAAKALLDGKQYTRAAELYRDLKQFDEAIHITQNHPVAQPVKDKIVTQARLVFFSQNKIKQATVLFDNPEDVLEYLEDRDLDNARAAVLVDLGRISEAAELHLSEGRTSTAIELFLKDQNNDQSVRQATTCILQSLWSKFSFGVRPEMIDSSASEMLDFARRLDPNHLEPYEQEQIRMFEYIASMSFNELGLLGAALYAKKPSFRAATLLSLDYYYSKDFHFSTLDAPGVADKLNIFSIYVQLMSHLLAQRDYHSNVEIMLLFGIQRFSENRFLLPVNSYLHDRAARLPNTSTVDDDLIVSSSDLRLVLQQSVKTRLSERGSAQMDIASRKTPAFFPCPAYTVHKSCSRPDCPEAHLDHITPELYNARVRIHLQQIFILQMLDSNLDLHRRRYWIRRLHEALYPPTFALGAYPNVDFTALTPEAQKGLQIAKEWVRTLIYSLKLEPPIPFLTDLIRYANLALLFDRDSAPYYLRQRDYMPIASFRPARYVSRNGYGYIVDEVLHALQGDQDFCLLAGLEVVKHVINHKLPIYASVICDFIEYLGTSLIAATRYFRFKTIHDVTLPRSWIIQHLHPNETIQRNQRVPWQLLLPFVELMGTFLQHMSSSDSADYLLYGTNRTLATVSFHLRAMFISRICRFLGLLGYNLRTWNYSELQTGILKTIQTLRRPDGRLFHRSYSRYLYAESWSDIVTATRSSMRDSPLDHLVQLIESGRTVNYSGIRQVVYKKPSEIRALLQASHNQEYQAEPATQVVEQVAPLAEMVPLEVDIDVPETNIPQTQELVAHTEKELEAISVIQRIYRLVLARRQRASDRNSRGILADTRNSLFDSCAKETEKLEPGKYRCILRAFLPHILLCLDIVKTDLHREKQATKKHLAKTHKKNQDLDELEKRLTLDTRAFKQALELQKALSPSSEIHQKGDVEQLKQLVRAVKALFDELHIEPSEDLFEDLEEGFTRIVEPKKPPPEPEAKPSLNTSDL